MSNPNPPLENLEKGQWKPGQSGNPNGRPKGSLNLATRIQKMLNDDEFTAQMIDGEGKAIKFKGNPAEAIIRTAILKSMGGDKKWAEWLAKHGFGTKQIHEFESSPVEQILEKYGLREEGKKTETETEETEADDRQTTST